MELKKIILLIIILTPLFCQSQYELHNFVFAEMPVWVKRNDISKIIIYHKYNKALASKRHEYEFHTNGKIKTVKVFEFTGVKKGYNGAVYDSTLLNQVDKQIIYDTSSKFRYKKNQYCRKFIVSNHEVQHYYAFDESGVLIQDFRTFSKDRFSPFYQYHLSIKYEFDTCQQLLNIKTYMDNDEEIGLGNLKIYDLITINRDYSDSILWHYEYEYDFPKVIKEIDTLEYPDFEIHSQNYACYEYDRNHSILTNPNFDFEIAYIKHIITNVKIKPRDTIYGGHKIKVDDNFIYRYSYRTHKTDDLNDSTFRRIETINASGQLISLEEKQTLNDKTRWHRTEFLYDRGNFYGTKSYERKRKAPFSLEFNPKNYKLKSEFIISDDYVNELVKSMEKEGYKLEIIKNQ